MLTHKRKTSYTDTEATLKIIVLPDNKRLLKVAEGNGPVNALDKALREALSSSYPEIKTLN